MKFTPTEPPRVFRVGFDQALELRDCARIELAPDEQVTFVTDAGAEYDVVRKAWGFYATPSINGRLARFGWRTALVGNRLEQLFVLLVQAGAEDQFQAYAQAEQLHLLAWLDEPAALKRLRQSLAGAADA